MPQSPKPVSQPSSPSRGNPTFGSSGQSGDISKDMVKFIDALSGGLQTYPIRELVKHAQAFGPYLKKQRLETNQVRKFLDAINRLKADLTQDDDFTKIETEVILLQPKLAYAAARQPAAKPLSDVMAVAINKVYSREDFDRLVQLIESIIAYHKAEGGK
jgi:CRISPR-associated protein Csm2